MSYILREAGGKEKQGGGGKAVIGGGARLLSPNPPGGGIKGGKKVKRGRRGTTSEASLNVYMGAGVERIDTGTITCWGKKKTTGKIIMERGGNSKG